MASYVVVNTTTGHAVIWGRSEILGSRKEAIECAQEINQEKKTNVYEPMLEMEWYRVYMPSTHQFILDSEKRRAEEKVQRQLARAAKKAAEEKKLAAAKAYWANDRNFA